MCNSREFDKWMSAFRDSISDYKYYINFGKVFNNVDKIKVELNILNSLIASKEIEKDFERLVENYPETLKCIPVLLAVRQQEIKAMDVGGAFTYEFGEMNQTVEQYSYFMRETGLFKLLESHIINNLVDYVTGVEVGLDSNGRKNRGGHLMEDVVESFIKELKLPYYKEMYAYDVEAKWMLDLSTIINQGKASKRFDFVIEAAKQIYVIETNFYASGGSKLNETARSYKLLAQEFKSIDGITFVWITDGLGWKSAKRNLQETFDVLEDIYNLNDLENGILKKIM